MQRRFLELIILAGLTVPLPGYFQLIRRKMINFLRCAVYFRQFVWGAATRRFSYVARTFPHLGGGDEYRSLGWGQVNGITFN